MSYQPHDIGCTDATVRRPKMCKTDGSNMQPSVDPLQILSAFSDGLFVSPAVFSAGAFARKSKDAYFYHFDHSPRSGPYAAVSHSIALSVPYE